MINPLDPQANYQVPRGESKYMKFEQGNNEFMPLASAIVGYEYWVTIDGKEVPERARELPAQDELPMNVRRENDGYVSIKHFWAFPVWDYSDGRVKVLQITQKGIMSAIRNYTLNPKWGSPILKYSFTVHKSGEMLNTEYTIMANPATPLEEGINNAWHGVQEKGFDLDELFTNGDPFAPATKPQTTSPAGHGAMPDAVKEAQSVDLKPGDIPFN